MKEMLQVVTDIGWVLLVAFIIWLCNRTKPPRGGTNGGY